MKYVTITEEEFDLFMESHGYSQLKLDRVKEKVYHKKYNDISVRVFSTIEGGITREKGKDAIRSVIHSDKLDTDIGGSKRTNRTGESSLGVLERLALKLEELELQAQRYDTLYTGLPTYIVQNVDTLVRDFLTKCIVSVTSIKKGKTKKGDENYQISLRTNFMTTDNTPIVISFRTMPKAIPELFGDDLPEIGTLYYLLALNPIYKTNSSGYAVWVNVGKYNYVFNKSDLYLIPLDPESEIFEDDGSEPILLAQNYSGDTDIETMEHALEPDEELDLSYLESPKKPTTLDTFDDETPDVSDIEAKEFEEDHDYIEEDTIPVKVADTYLKGKYTFDLNPMQSKVWQTHAIQDGNNLVVSSPTASGKTVVAELAIQRCIDNYKTAVYLAPMKALVEEKLEDWKKTFPEAKISILTGDYELTEKQKKELNETDIIVMTNEMLSSRCTKHKTESNQWLHEVGVLVVDEAHLIGSQGRGDKLEVALMQFTNINPGAQILLLSATLGELDTLCSWITSLTDRQTILIESLYRPVILKIDYTTFADHRGPWDFDPKYRTTEQLIRENPDDKYIVFCSSRADSFKTADRLQQQGYDAVTHNATLTLKERQKIEHRFKEGDLQIICATPTLSIGVNMPAKRVIVQSVYRGMNEIESMEILQCIGRAGRPKYDTEGYATVILPESESTVQLARLQRVHLQSVLTKERDLLFHLNNAIYVGEIQTQDEAIEWWRRTLAYRLDTTCEISIEDCLAKLMKMNIIEEVTSLTHTYIKCAKLGEISALLFHYPDDVLQWKRNFEHVKKDELFFSDLHVARAMLSVTQRENEPYVRKDETPIVEKFWIQNAQELSQYRIDQVEAKHIMRNVWALTDEHDLPGSKAAIYNIRADSERMLACVQMIDGFHGWGERREWIALGLRIRYGVPRGAIDLVTIKGVGRVRAIKLMKEDIHNAHDIVQNEVKVLQILGPTVGEQVLSAAKKITGKWNNG